MILIIDPAQLRRYFRKVNAIQISTNCLRFGKPGRTAMNAGDIIEIRSQYNMNTTVTTGLSDANFAILSPTGSTISIPVSYDPMTDVFTHMKDPGEIRKHYIENGYVIQRSLIPPDLCDAVAEAFRKEVKSHPGSFYRQASGLAEKHKFTANNFMLNAVMNIQDLDKSKFGTFQKLGLKILTHANIRNVLHALMQGEALVAQTMYFEGNPATWPHQDKDYLDATRPGAMVAAWVAVEDIQPGAGRFYVYPGSHKIDIEKLGRHLNIMLDKDAYIKLVVETINKYKLECVAPALRKGDVLFWHGKTIHGSLTTAQPQHSRQSFTAHYMPIARTLIQLQVREKKLKLREVDGMKVNFPKDQNQLSNKLMFLMETTFPKAFKKVKASAIRMHHAKQ